MLCKKKQPLSLPFFKIFDSTKCIPKSKYHYCVLIQLKKNRGMGDMMILKIELEDLIDKMSSINF